MNDLSDLLASRDKLFAAATMVEAEIDAISAIGAWKRVDKANEQIDLYIKLNAEPEEQNKPPSSNG